MSIVDILISVLPGILIPAFYYYCQKASNEYEEAVKHFCYANEIGKLVGPIPMRNIPLNCPNCGAPITNNHLCEYCGTTFTK